MGNYKQEKENVIDVVSNAIAGYVKKTSASEKIVHYVEIEFEKENGFSIDDCYKIRLELELIKNGFSEEQLMCKRYQKVYVWAID